MRYVQERVVGAASDLFHDVEELSDAVLANIGQGGNAIWPLQWRTSEREHFHGKVGGPVLVATVPIPHTVCESVSCRASARSRYGRVQLRSFLFTCPELSW